MKLLLISFSSDDLMDGAKFANALKSEMSIFAVAYRPLHGPEANQVWFYEDGPQTAESICTAIEKIATGFDYIVASSSMAAKDSLARLAGTLNRIMVSDVIEVVSSHCFKRPIFAGAAIATVETPSLPICITFRAPSFRNLEVGSSMDYSPLGCSPDADFMTTVISSASRKSGRPDLSQANVIVSGGKPLKDAETFEKIIGKLADKMGGAVGATRAAVDAGIASNELQIGQTGKVVAPNLYIAAGISGSTQHVAGIKDSKTIVAINKDPDAPIFQIADVGLVADLFEALPELTEKL